MGTGIDRLETITLEQLRQLKAEGPVNWLAFYLDSPCQRLTRWSPALVAELLPELDGVLPIYVGSNDAQFGCATELTAEQGLQDAADARDQLAKFGARHLAGHPCVLDIEAPTYANRPQDTLVYATAWAAAMTEWGYWPVFYSSGECLSRLAGHFGIRAFYWLASWVYARYSDAAESNLNARARGSRLPISRALWQYAAENRNNALGGAVDWNVGNPPLLGPHNME